MGAPGTKLSLEAGTDTGAGDDRAEGDWQQHNLAPVRWRWPTFTCGGSLCSVTTSGVCVGRPWLRTAMCRRSIGLNLFLLSVRRCSGWVVCLGRLMRVHRGHLFHLTGQPSVGDSADALMSVGHFHRSFREAYGETPYAHLMTRRVERAAWLLRQGELSVTDVCMQVGCTSLGSFSSRFTELMGETPSDYWARSHDERAGIPSCVAKQVDRPTRARANRSGSEKRSAVAGA